MTPPSHLTLTATLLSARSAVASAYGAAGALLILLVWVYYSAQLQFLGAEFTQVFARRFGSRIIPDNSSEGLVPAP